MPIEAGASTVERAQAPGSPGTAGVPLAGGVLAGIAASVCCVGPPVLVLAGLSGAWIGSLEALTPYRWIPIGIAAILFAWAGKGLFLVPRVCAPGSACADPKTLRWQRIVFGLALGIVTVLVAFPWYAPWLL
jgi:mercuric ion transport protein